jgi:hypothetical protein
MGRRQLTRLLLTATAVVALALVVTTVRGTGSNSGTDASPGPDTPVPLAAQPPPPPGDEAAYVREARRLTAALSAFAVLATDLVDHEALVEGRSGLDEAAADLAGVHRRNSHAASASRNRLAALAGTVHERWLTVRPVALSERTAEEGVLLVQALGREAGVRSAGLRSALGSLEGPALTAALDVELARPWPDDALIGADTPV